MSNKMLIICYSQSGNTHRVAVEIQRQTQGELCQIYPWQPYPMAFTELLAQVRREVQTGYHPRLLPGACDPKPYPLIFAGSPNWCGTIAPPLASWLAKNDLSGKVILPFYSHCGGVAGDLAGDIAALCPRADVRAALGVIGTGGTELPALLKNWINNTQTHTKEDYPCNIRNSALRI